jgi:hypothetical protein
MTPIATRPKTQRRSATASDGARPYAAPAQRRDRFSIRLTVATDPVETVRGTVRYMLITYVIARGTARRPHRSHYSHSDNHRA